MSTITKDLGAVSAYAYAVEKGYTGTEAEYAELMASYATVAQQASQSAQTATEKAQQASASATSAQTAQQTATAKASEAQQSAQTATTKAQEASQSASTASQKAQEASQSATDAESAKTASETAQASAESARDDAESARDTAQQYAESIDPQKLIGAYPVDTASGSIASFTDGADNIPMKSVKVRIEPVQDLSKGDPSPDNICPISGWDSVQMSHSGADRTNPTTKTIPLPQTVYGGTLDVTTGELVVDRAMVDLGTLTWIKSSNPSSVSGSVFQTPISGIGMAGRNRYEPNVMVASMFATAPDDRWFINTMLDNEVFSNASTMYISASQYTDAYAFKTAMSGVQLCYELAEPITLTLSLTEIRSLLGDNNVWGDTGDSIVTYRADTTLYINRKIAEAISALS